MRFPFILIALVFASEAFAVRSCFVEIGSRRLLLNRWVERPTEAIATLLQVLQEIPESKVAALEFGARYARGEVSVTRLASEYGVGARTFYEDEGISVALDSNEFGLLLIHLYHEIVHALDSEALEKLRRADLSPQEKQATVFEAERRAFDAQAVLLESLRETHRCSDSYFTEHEKKGSVLARNPTDEEIKKLYRLGVGIHPN
ncbi:MAG: hypothetical protein R3B54_17565 [Bdellovibrionota bacterium]